MHNPRRGFPNAPPVREHAYRDNSFRLIVPYNTALRAGGCAFLLGLCTLGLFCPREESQERMIWAAPHMWFAVCVVAIVVLARMRRRTILDAKSGIIEVEDWRLLPFIRSHTSYPLSNAMRGRRGTHTVACEGGTTILHDVYIQWKGARSDTPVFSNHDEDTATHVYQAIQIYLGQHSPPPVVAKPNPTGFIALPLVSSASSGVCRICGTMMVVDRVVCRKCETPHHADCWSYNGGCSTYGCGGR